MGWVNSPDLFCATSDTVADLVNIVFRSDLQVPLAYPPTANLYDNSRSPTTSPDRLQYADVYMDDINCLTQGNSHQQQRITEIILVKLKSVYLTVKGVMEKSISLKKTRAGDGNWRISKEVLGWIINTSLGTISLSPKRLTDLTTLLDIPPGQRRQET